MSAYARLDASAATWSNGHERAPQHDRVADVVDAAPAGPAGELRVLARREELVALAGELRQLLDDDRAGRHVDAERERLGGEHAPSPARATKHSSTASLNGGTMPGVVGGDAGLEPGQPPVVAEHVEVVVGQPSTVRSSAIAADAPPLLRRR